MWIDPICLKKKKKDQDQMYLLFWKYSLITILRTDHCFSYVTSISNTLLYGRTHYTLHPLFTSLPPLVDTEIFEEKNSTLFNKYSYHPTGFGT